jgi:hypothetical protein
MTNDSYVRMWEMLTETDSVDMANYVLSHGSQQEKKAANDFLFIQAITRPSSSMAERPAHNGTVIGSSPVAVTTEYCNASGYRKLTCSH